METIECQTFEDESVRLDGKHFINCTFVGCILEYHGGEVAFDRTQMTRCQHVFYGRARRTIHFLQSVGLMPYKPSDWGEFDNSIH